MKKLLLLLLIAVVGAGIAFGANAVVFSPASNELPATEPRGLVDEIAADDAVDDEPVRTPKPAKSPKPVPTASPAPAASSGGSSGTAPLPAPTDDGSPRDPRTPDGYTGGPEPSSFVIQGVVDEQDPPDDPCDLEESERDQQRCENEADRDEDEADREADEDDPND